MALNIKNPEAHALANELAELTGMSITAVVIEALRHQVAHYKKAPKEQQRLNDFNKTDIDSKTHLLNT